MEAEQEVGDREVEPSGVNFDYGITILRLEGGKPVKILENGSEENKQERESAETEQNSSPEWKTETAEAEFIEEFQRKKGNFRALMNRRRPPRFLKFFYLGFLALVLLAAAIFIGCSAANMLRVLNVGQYFSLYDSLSSIKTIAQKQLHQYSLRIMNSPIIIFRDDALFDSTFYELVDEFENQQKVLLSFYSYLGDATITEFFERPDVVFNQNEKVVNATIWDAMKNILAQAFVVKKASLASLSRSINDYNDFYENVMSSFQEKMKACCELTLTRAWQYLALNRVVFFLLGLHIFLLLACIVLIYLFLRKMKERMADLLLLLLEIPASKLRTYCLQAELFRKMVISGENDEIKDLLICDEGAAEGHNHPSKSRAKKIKANFKVNRAMLIKTALTFLLLSLVFFFQFSFY